MDQVEQSKSQTIHLLLPHALLEMWENFIYIS